MTPARLAALREAERRATKGEWRTEKDRNEQENIYAGGYDEWIARLPHQCITPIQRAREYDALFICEMRNALPDLLDALDRAHALLREARAAAYILGQHRADLAKDIDPLLANIDAELEGQ